MSRILVIEDDVSIRAFLREILEGAGYDVKEFSTGQEGLRFCREFSVPLVVTDIIMPDMDGVEVIRVLRQSSPQTKIVAISGGFQWTGPSMLEISKRLGADLVFEKPFDIEIFLRELQILAMRDKFLRELR